MRTINEAGRDLIKDFEGLRLKAYRCPAGKWTIGWGHTKQVWEGMEITKHEAELLFSADIAEYERYVEKALKRPATDDQFAAFVSLAFNIGTTKFGKSTALRRFNAGDLAGAAEALTWFNKITKNGQLLLSPGLVRRREAERVLFWSDIEQDVKAQEGEPAGEIVGGESKPLAKSKTVWGLFVAALIWTMENFGSLWAGIPEELKAISPWLMALIFGFLLLNRVSEALKGEH